MKRRYKVWVATVSVAALIGYLLGGWQFSLALAGVSLLLFN